MKTYVIEGSPVSLKRPKKSIFTSRLYNSQKNLMLILSISLKSQHGNLPLLCGPLHLDVTFYMPYTNSHKRRGIKLGDYHYQKPDLSNLQKLMEDVSNNVIIEDDARISSVSAKKIFDANPRTEFSFMQLKGKNGKKD